MNRLLLLIFAACLGWGANRSFPEVLRDARGGDAESQYIAGMMLMFGQGTSQNLQEAVKWLEMSAKTGMPQALVSLAALYDIGQGVPFDPARADALRGQAAQGGNAFARGQMENDRRMAGQRDFRRASALTDLKMYDAALVFAKKAAEAGSANGQLLLGRAYHFGLGTAKDLVAAVGWYRKSEAGKLADGARALAYMYEFGLGVKVDRTQALVYYDRAAARGSALAKRAAENLRSPDYDQPVNYKAGGGTDLPRCTGGYSLDYANGICVSSVPGLRPYNP